MGITVSDSHLLFYAKSKGVDFENTCMLGRLVMYTSPEQVLNLVKKYNIQKPSFNFNDLKEHYSEPLFRLLGAGKIDSLDFSDYENATLIHDMNNPLPENLYGKYSCVVDGGTLEHIFNFPVAIANCMKLLKPGGHFIGISPVNNQMGHGFYQFSPELYYRVFSPENGFEMVNMFVSYEDGDKTEWYEVADPKNVKNRVMLVNSVPISLRFIAKKVSDVAVFSTNPQQSDYVNTWNAVKSLKESNPELSGSRFQYLYKKILPYRVKVFLRNVYNLFRKEQVESPSLGVIDPEHYRKVDI